MADHFLLHPATARCVAVCSCGATWPHADHAAQHIPIAQIPPFLNGYRVIAALPVRNWIGGLMIVLVHRPEHRVHKYLTATWSPRCGDTWDNGDYVETLDEALASLLRRSLVASLAKEAA